MEEKLERILLRSRCDGPGTLKLSLKRGNKLVQNGPKLTSSTEWLKDYEDFAEFTVICTVKEM